MGKLNAASRVLLLIALVTVTQLAAQSPAENGDSVSISRLPSVSLTRDWMDRASFWLTAVLVGATAGTLAAVYYQAKETKLSADATREATEAIQQQVGIMERQTKASEDAAKAALASTAAFVNSERARLTVELRPLAIRDADGRFYHSLGDRRFAMTPEDVLRGQHLRYVVKLTNLGRTPAYILDYQVSYTCLGEDVTDLPENAQGDFVEHRAFDQILPAAESIEITEPVVDVFHFIRDCGRADIDSLKKTAVIHGWVRYRHIFSDNAEKVPILYVYTASEKRLSKASRPWRQEEPSS